MLVLRLDGLLRERFGVTYRRIARIEGLSASRLGSDVGSARR
jgi:hypothetical protein